jgi:hypothetical protein
MRLTFVKAKLLSNNAGHTSQQLGIIFGRNTHRHRDLGSFVGILFS